MDLFHEVGKDVLSRDVVTMDVDNSVDTILSRIDKEHWIKLEDDDRYVQLYRKFWCQNHQQEQLSNLHQQGSFDEDNDVDSDCFVLDHGMPFVFGSHSKLWVHKEYLRIYERCNDHLGTALDDGPPRSLVITGQPGIGRCFTL